MPPASGRFGDGVSFLELMASVSSTDGCNKQSNPCEEQGNPFPEPLLGHEIHNEMAEEEPGCRSAVEKNVADSDWDGSMDGASEDDDGDDEFSGDDDDDGVLYNSECNGNQYSLENQEITVGYCSAGDGPAVRNHEFPSGGRANDGQCPTRAVAANENHEYPAVGSANDGQCSTGAVAANKVAAWGKMSPLANNDTIMGTIEYAMRNPRSQEQMFLPRLGQMFPSLGDAYQLYNLYSWEMGFSIRKGNNQSKSNYVTDDGQKVKIMQEFRCQRAVSNKPTCTICELICV